MDALRLMRYQVAPDVERVIRAAFPSWRGRKVRIAACERLTLQDMYWSGGSRSEYVAVNIATMQAGSPSQQTRNPPQFGGPRVTPEVEIPPGCVIVEHSIFCGKDAWVRLHVHPSNMPAMLPAPEGPEGKAA